MAELSRPDYRCPTCQADGRPTAVAIARDIISVTVHCSICTVDWTVSRSDPSRIKRVTDASSIESWFGRSTG